MPPKRKKNTRSMVLKSKVPKKNADSEGNSQNEQNLKQSDNSLDSTNCNTTVDENEMAEQSQLITGKSSGKPAYTCKKCSKKFKLKSSYTEHLFKEHSQLPTSISCSQCSATCPTKEVLQEHIEKTHQRDIFVCPGCDKEFVRRSHVLRHMTQSGCNGKQVVTFPCEICDSVFTRKDNLMVHLRSKHMQRGSHFCKFCKYHTKNFNKLISHWHKNHAETPNLYECHHCGKATSSRPAMAKHLEIHGERKFGCSVCGYSTFTVEVMRRHVLTHVDNKPYRCHLCSRSYIQRLQLQRHLEKHTENICVVCGENFTTSARLIRHQREHMGLEKLHCPIESCPFFKKEILSEAKLEAHLKTHLGEKNFQCKVCGKKFHVELNMKRHTATHTLDRPRRCMYCVAARAYVRGEQLVRHVRRHHPAIFRSHLAHVRTVLGVSPDVERVKKSELESILNVLDAESERIMQGFEGSGVLYGGLQENSDEEANADNKEESGPLMTEEDLADNLNKLLLKLIDKETLECFGWPEVSVDLVLERVIMQCGSRPLANGESWTRMQRLRENAKHLFLYVIEDKTISDMLATHTIDQIIKHILTQVSEDEATS